MNIQHYSEYKVQFEQYINHLVSSYQFPAPIIKQAIEYSTMLGGKRIRPILTYLCGELFDIDKEPLHIVASSIEFIHCYSLIHDDLPAMDNDDFRRGKPSCHRQFDEATAILAGDGLQSIALEHILTLENFIQPSQVIKIAKAILHASGPYGMISGQSMDLTLLCQTPSTDENTLNQIHLLKTGKLFQAIINAIILIDNQNSEQVITTYTKLRHYSTHIGLAFQIQDDYLDRYGDINILGKKQRSDINNDKATYANLYNQKQLKQLVEHHYYQACNAIEAFGEKAYHLKELTLDLLSRSTLSHANS